MVDKLVPKLRFKEFDDEWKTVKLDDASDRITRKNKNMETRMPLTISAQYGLINQEEYFDKQIASKNLKNYYLLYNGEFAYNKSYSNDYPLGAIKKLNNYEKGAISTLYICFKPKNIDSNFLEHYFESTKWYKEIYKIAVEGARNHGLLNISITDFFNTKHSIPKSKKEQEKIAECLTSIDKKIKLLEEKLENFHEFKRGLLDGIFSDKLRFPDFEDEWETVKLDSLIKKGKAGGTPSSTNPLYYGGNIPFLSIKDMTEQGKYIVNTEKSITQKGLDNSSAWIIPKNSLLYSIYASIGLVAINQIEISTSQAIFAIILKEGFSLEYLYYYLSYFKKNVHKYIETGTQGNLNAGLLKSFDIALPSLKEQEKIAEFLTKIDERINLLEKQLKLTQQFKKGLLQQMFI